MAKFNIYGTCVCRDLFGLVNDTQHEVLGFLQSSSPIINFKLSDKGKEELSLDAFNSVKGVNHFKQKCIINDYNKTLKEYFSLKSDFFIIDLVTIANTNLYKETFADGSYHYFTKSKWFELAYANGLNEEFKKHDSELTVINRLELLDDATKNEVLDNFIKWLTVDLGYAPKQIILLENKRARMYLEDGHIRFFSEPNTSEINLLIDELDRLFKEKLPKCKVVPSIDWVYSDTEHKWGLTNLHFCMDYYEYLYKCITAITEGSSPEEIRKIHDIYSNLMEEKVIRGIKNGIDLISPCNFVNDFIADEEKNTEVIGDNKKLLSSWYTKNSTTCVNSSEDSICLKHSGSVSTAQVNLLYQIDASTFDNIRGKWVTFSVMAKCDEISSDRNIGGTIGIIDKNDYNKGVFYKSKTFNNKNWEKVSVTAKIPENAEGVTLCVRANTGNGKRNSIVNFKKPCFTMGVYPAN